MMPTALNNGMAVPHTRDFLLDAHYDVIAIAFSENPVDYGALDGKPVHTLFFMFASDDQRHLHLLAKLAHFTMQESTREFLQTHPDKLTLLRFVKEWERSLARVTESI